MESTAGMYDGASLNDLDLQHGNKRGTLFLHTNKCFLSSSLQVYMFHIKDKYITSLADARIPR